MSSEYEKKNQPNPGQKDDKSMGGRQGQNPQGGETGREDSENRREGTGGQQRKPSPSSGQTTDEPETE